MRPLHFCFCWLVFAVLPGWGQQFQPPQQAQPVTGPPQVTKDAQAVSVVTQTLIVGGGATAISSIGDYTATGTVTYHLSTDVQGTITMRALGLGEFRMDANLPAGVRSEAITEDFTSKTEDGTVRHNQAPMSPSRLVIPNMLLAPALNSAGFNVVYNGLVEIDSHSVHDIQLQRVLPVADPGGQFREYHTADFFIDPATFQIVMMQDVVSLHSIRQVRYSDYKSVSGVLVPFSIKEQVNGQAIWEINLGQIAFNSGLKDSDFQL
jgi:hypothetical protein